MKKKSKILRNILIGAITSLYSSNATSSDLSSMSMKDDLGHDANHDITEAMKKKVFHNVLKISKSNGTNRTLLISSHTSHRSHSSHRSSSSGYRPNSPSSSSNGTTYKNTRPSSNSNSTKSTTTTKSTPKTYKTYELGDRILTLGDYGSDVRTLTKLLVDKNYMNEAWVSMRNDYPVYDEKVVDAIKRFEKDAHMTEDGQASSLVVEKLRTWNKYETTLILGIRELKYDRDSEYVGSDVYELIELLDEAGFPPNPEKLKKSGKMAFFTSDIEVAVKLFQAYNGLTPTGIVDDETIARLRRTNK